MAWAVHRVVIIQSSFLAIGRLAGTTCSRSLSRGAWGLHLTAVPGHRKGWGKLGRPPGHGRRRMVSRLGYPTPARAAALVQATSAQEMALETNGWPTQPCRRAPLAVHAFWPWGGECQAAAPRALGAAEATGQGRRPGHSLRPTLLNVLTLPFKSASAQ